MLRERERERRVENEVMEGERGQVQDGGGKGRDEQKGGGNKPNGKDSRRVNVKLNHTTSAEH